MNRLKMHSLKSILLNILALLSTATVLFSGSALSHSGASGIVKERMDAMSDMGDRSRLVADMFKGKVIMDSQVIAAAAEVFIEHGSMMPELFPDTDFSRTGSETEALSAIWMKWDEFTDLADKLVSDSEKLQSVVANTDDDRALKRAFFQTTKSCSGCHKRFRKPKE